MYTAAVCAVKRGMHDVDGAMIDSTRVRNEESKLELSTAEPDLSSRTCTLSFGPLYITYIIRSTLDLKYINI